MDVTVRGDAVLRYFWRGFAKIYGNAVFQDQVVFVFYQFGKFRCAICGILLFSVQFWRFQSPPPPTPHHIMADTGVFINVLNQEDYETREHCNEDSHLLIEEPIERSQKVKRNIGVRHEKDKHQALSRQCVVWLPVKLEHF